MRLIDANIFDAICYTQKSSEFSEGVEFILDKIDNAPTINATPVVRCKDCKFYETAQYDEGTKQVCRLLTRQFHPDDFCSYGVRKEELINE